MLKQLALYRLRTRLLAALVALALVSIAAAPVGQPGDPQAQADGLFSEAKALLDAGQWEAALEKLEMALTVYRAAGDLEGEGLCLLYIGHARHRLGDYSGALDAYRLSGAIWQEVDNPVGVGVTLNNMGTVYQDLAQYQEALDALQLAVEVARAIPDRDSEATRLNNIGQLYSELGQYRRALDYYYEALAVQDEMGDLDRQGTTLGNIASVYADLGQYQQSLKMYQMALTVAVDIRDRAGEGKRLNNIGTVYTDLGQYEEALASYEQAQVIGREIGDRSLEGAALDNIAQVHADLGDYEQALDYYQQALTIARGVHDRAGEGVTLSNIGNVYFALGLYEQALDFFQPSLTIAEEIGDRPGEAATLNNIGAVHSNMEQYPQALDHYQQALSVLQQTGERAGTATTLVNIGVVCENLGEYDQAISFHQQAIDIIESIQGEIGIEELKASYAGGREQARAYARLINVLWLQGRPSEAFDYAERARARAFLDQIGNQQVDFRQGAAPGLIEQEKELRQQIIGLQTAIAAEKAKPLDQQRQELLGKWSSDLEQARAEYERLLTRLKLDSSEYASLVSVTTLSLEQVQNEVLDGYTTLIEYFVMEEYPLAWVIDQEGSELIKLGPSRGELRNKIQYLRDLIAEREYDTQTAATLYEALFAPLTPHIRHSNLIIVPHRALHYLPFGALWDAENERFLIQDYALTFAPSASVLQFILDKRSSDDGRLLALGNPDGTLPHAGDEAQAVASLFDTSALLRDEATERQVSAKAGQLDHLLLAAHGVYDRFNPLFTRIELAGDDGEDGNLEVHEVFGLDLTGANMVVLSACNTALGEQSEGDELVGLTRAFLYAGSPAVVTSLWAVDDAASGVLMEAFYRHLKEGQTNAEALRTAQLEVLEQDQWRSPYYWAAFTLTGDCRGSEEPGMSTEQTPEAAEPAPRDTGGGPCATAALPLGLVLLAGILGQPMLRTRACLGIVKLAESMRINRWSKKPLAPLRRYAKARPRD